VGIALFDLDNTLIAGDSDYLWGCFLVEQGIVDGSEYEQANQRFYDQYKVGELDIREFLAFQLRPLAVHPMARLQQWRARYIEEKIRPILLPRAQALIERHRRQGDVPVIITATNRFITEPIAGLYGIEHLLATEPEIVDNRYTGRYLGTPTYQEGKVTVLQAWLDEHGTSLEGAYFYSDSMNDISLLELVDNPVAVNPDDELEAIAKTRGWPILDLRQAGALIE